MGGSEQDEDRRDGVGFGMRKMEETDDGKVMGDEEAGDWKEGGLMADGIYWNLI